MAVKKTQLYSSLWASCDELRGGMDASQYKNYILTLLFVKYVSDKYAGQPYSTLVVPPEGSFEAMRAADGDSEIGEKLNQVVAALAKANNLDWLQNADNDFNNEDRLGKGKTMVDTLSKLVRIFGSLELGKNRADGDDLIGDAYEFLMRNFATESGKSKGQFYTPAEVSSVMAQLLEIDADSPKSTTVYDPTCGSGSLLLKLNDQTKNGLSLYGQEKDQSTLALARMNMVLHDAPESDMHHDDTLSAPQWKEDARTLKRFDFVVANPPFSYKSWNNGINQDEDIYKRFEYGIPPEKNGDYAFLLHILKSLKSSGRGAVILPHGVLFRGNAEAGIRRKLIQQGYIKGIIGLPANLFYGTGIPACIVVLDKAGAGHQRPIFMVDASKGFAKDGPKNRLRAQDVHRIVDCFKGQHEIDRYARLVPFDEIAEKNDYNLNIPRYIDASDPEDLHDLNAHLNGGIPAADIEALSAYWDVLPGVKDTLFEPSGREGYLSPKVDAKAIKSSILAHPDFAAFKAELLKSFGNWRAEHQPTLENITVGDLPKELIYRLSEDLLHQFDGLPLIDKYNVYQLLMTYWEEVMQDDVHLLVQDDWSVASSVRQLVPEMVKKDGKVKAVWHEEHHFEFGTRSAKKRFRSDIIPPALIAEKYFADQVQSLAEATAAKELAVQEWETFVEENTGDDGVLIEALDEKSKVTQKSLKAAASTAIAEDMAAFDRALKLIKAEAAAKKAEKAAQTALDLQVFEKIPALTETEGKGLVVEAKWLSTLETKISEEVERLTQALANRLKQLSARYERTLPELDAEVNELSTKVDEHLKAMGLAW